MFARMYAFAILVSLAVMGACFLLWIGSNSDVWAENRRLNLIAARVPELELQLAAAQREIVRLKVMKAAIIGPRDNRTRVAPQYHAPLRLPNYDDTPEY